MTKFYIKMVRFLLGTMGFALTLLAVAYALNSVGVDPILMFALGSGSGATGALLYIKIAVSRHFRELMEED